MEKNVFRLSDNEKCGLLFDALNNSEDSFKIICDIYDDYAIAYDAVAGKYLRVYYTKNNEANTVVIDKIEDCYIVDVSEIELNALNAMKAVGTYAEIQAKLEEQSTQIEAFTADKNSLTEQLAAAQARIEEFENQKVSSEEPNEDFKKDDEDKKDEDEKDKNALSEEVKAEIEGYKSAIQEKDAEIARLNQLNSDITNEKSELESYKKSVDTEKKTSIINEFAAHLSEEQIADFTAKMDDFSIEDFKKEVCFAAYNANSSIFSQKKEDEEPDLIFKNTGKDNLTGALKLLENHKNKGGNK